MIRIAFTFVLLSSCASLCASPISSTVMIPFDGGTDCAELAKSVANSAYQSLLFSALNFADVKLDKSVTSVKEATHLAWLARARYFIMGSAKRVDGKICVSGDVYLSATGKSIGSFKASEDEKSLDALNKSVAKQIHDALPKDTFKKIILPETGGKKKQARINDGFEDEWNTPPVLQTDVGFRPLRDSRVQVNSQHWHRDTVTSNSPYPPSRQEINNWVKDTGSSYGQFLFLGAITQPHDFEVGTSSPPDISNFNRPEKYYGGINDYADRLGQRWNPNNWTNAVLTPLDTQAVGKLQSNPMPPPARPAPQNPTSPHR